MAYGRGEAACAELVEAWLGDAAQFSRLRVSVMAERNGCFVMERDYAFTMRENRADLKSLAEFPRI
ncbi:hypothetical protein EFR84_18795 [Rhizobium chutanense]|uniref:Uncharacterized protein n=1 Tax=Rhizobium chutanense TaxID=2035448 RepID=A0A3S0QW36_9HYPH|nr:hypothetical protein EFR84_18795 [Rhizobium chutanense]